jgi:perosamine synthetase
MPRRLSRLPPIGGPIGWSEVWAGLRSSNPDEPLRRQLQDLLGAEVITLHASGREALRVALTRLAEQGGRNEVIVPAYTCFSVPASVVAAGLRVRLVDVTSAGWIDPDALARLPLERAAAIVVSNLLGVAEPIEPLRPSLRAAGVALVDDAAQCLGACAPEGPIGARGDVGLLSFGRGKPLSALGGGALAWSRRSDAPNPATKVSPRRLLALLRVVAYDLALVPWMFRTVSGLPFLGIGETHYDPGFRRGAIDGASACLAAALLPGLGDERRRRQDRAERLARRIREATRFTPLVGSPGAGVYPRLGVLAPCASSRDAALASLSAFGVTRLYPSSLDCLEALAPERVGDDPCPGARDFAARLLTLPTHAGLHSQHVEEIVRAFERMG